MVESHQQGQQQQPQRSVTAADRSTSSGGSFHTTYMKSKWTLVYTDSDVEARFFRYIFCGTPIYGLKLMYGTMVAGLLLVYLPLHYHINEWFHIIDIEPLVNVVAATAALISTFMTRFDTLREDVGCVILALNALAFMWYEFVHKYPKRGIYGYILGYNFCATLVPNFRLVRLLKLLPAMHVVSFVTTPLFVFDDKGEKYSDSYAFWHFYAWEDLFWWPMLMTPLALLYYMERDVRLGFEIMDHSGRELEAIEARLDLLKGMAVSYFPTTITRELVDAQKSKLVSSMTPLSASLHTQNFLFPESVIIITDVAGFTGWAARTDNHVVVEFLSDMFLAMDSLARHNHVEKVTTVGDSFVGAIFGKLNNYVNRNENNEPLTPALRCTHACHFGLGVHTAIRCLSHLRHRVGIHFGNVVGGFVGLSPPRFDIFGEAVEHAKYLESTCSVGKVHASHEVFSAIAAEVSTCGMPMDGTDTPYGTIFSIWDGGFIAGDGLAPAPHIESTFDEALSMSAPVVGEHREWVLGSLLALQNPHHVIGSGDDNDDDGREVDPRHRLSTHIVVGESDKKDIDDEPSSGSFDALNPFLLKFYDVNLEREYRDSVRAREGQQEILMLVILLNMTPFIIHFLSACADTTGDRVYIVATVVTLVMLVAFQSWSDPNSPGHAGRLGLIVFVMCIAPVISLTFVSTPCSKYGGGNPEEKIVRLSSVFTWHALTSICSVQFVNDVPLLQKFIALITSNICAVLQVPLRQYAIGDSVAEYDWMIMAAPTAFSAISYLTEWSLRRAFAAQVQIRHTLRSTGQHAKDTRRVLDVMLPSFATEKILKMKTDNISSTLQGGNKPNGRLALRLGGGGVSGCGDSASIGSSKGDVWSAASSAQPEPSINPLSDMCCGNNDDDDDDDVHSSAHSRPQLIWNYPALAVMFLSLQKWPQINNNNINNLHSEHQHQQNGDEALLLNFEFIKSQMEAMEKSVTRSGALKVKTCGTTMLCVCGVEQGGLDGASAVRRAVAATVNVVRDVLSRDELEALGYVWSIGLHCGACFGAVLGVRGLTFDVFGDTINTASRMMTTAGRNAAQLSAQVAEWLGASDADRGGSSVLPSGTSLVPLSPISVKGKGTMDVYRLEISVFS
eukprot:PhM_4_TR8401/c0_g3_i3/m.59142